MVSTWSCLWWPLPVVLLFGQHICLCVCSFWKSVCVRDTLTRSPKRTSLVFKTVWSHHASSLIHTNLATIFPVEETTQLGNNELKHRLRYVSHGKNTTKLNNTFPIAHRKTHTHTHTVGKQSAIHPGGILSRQGTVTASYRWDNPLGEKQKYGMWLSHSHLHMTVKLSYICSQFRLSALPKPHGPGW